MGGVEKCAPEVWFARDSPLEGAGFEPSVPRPTGRGASRNLRLPASVEMVEPLRRAAVESELLGL